MPSRCVRVHFLPELVAMTISARLGLLLNRSRGMRAWVVAAATLGTLIAFHPPAAASGPLFAAPFLSFDTGSNPNSVAIGDVNGDGKPDLVVANTYSSTVSVLLGNGDGTFGARKDFGTGIEPHFVAIGDLNGDSRPDLAVTSYTVDVDERGNVYYYNNTVSVLLGNGDGTFRTRMDLDPGSGPSSVVIGDFDGDGRQDLAVANSGSNTVSVLLGNGSGTFGVRTDYGTGNNPRSAAIGDLNGDGRPDLVVANYHSNTASVV